MKKSHLRQGFIATVLIVAMAIASSATLGLCADAQLPSIVLDGLSAYRTGGPDAAVRSWIKGSAVENSPEAQSQGNVFRQVESMYGKFIGYDTIKTKELTKSCTLVYLTLNYERGPLFALFVCYHAMDKWIISSFNFHTKPEQILGRPLPVE